MTNPLKAWRDERKLTQPAAAELVEVDAMTFSRWERGENFPRKNKWPKIEEVTGITPSQMIGHVKAGEAAQ